MTITPGRSAEEQAAYLTEQLETAVADLGGDVHFLAAVPAPAGAIVFLRQYDDSDRRTMRAPRPEAAKVNRR